MIYNNKKKYCILFLAFSIFTVLLLPEVRIKNIDKYLSFYNFNKSFDESKSYQGVFQSYHVFVDERKNGLLFYDIKSMKLKHNIYFKIGKNKGELSSLNNNASFRDYFWFVDQGNRVSYFKFENGDFFLKAVYYLSGIESVYKLHVNQNGLFAFGRDYNGNVKLMKYSSLGKKIETVKEFDKRIPGNIIIGTDYNNNIFYGFKYSSDFFVQRKNRWEKYSISREINTSFEKNRIQKNGIIYNFNKIGKYILATYWTVRAGGRLEIINLETENLLVTAAYPLGSGRIYKDKIYIYRTNFQDNELKSFIIELNIKKIITMLQ